MAPESENLDESGARSGERERVVSSRRLPASALDLVHGFVMLERPAAVTRNDAVRITQIAPYAVPSVPGGPFLVEQGWIALRIDTDAVTGTHILGAVDSADDGGGDALPALQLTAAGESSVHRCHALHDADRLVIDGLSRMQGALAGAADARQHPVPRRAEGEEPDQRERLDELLTQTTATDVLLPHRHVDPGVLFALLEHACHVALPVGIAVLSSAAMHTVQDAIQSVSPSSGLAVVTTHDAVIEIAVSDVVHCLLLRLHGPHGVTSMLELYDAEHRCLAVLSQYGMVGESTYDAWEHLVDSLPVIG